MEPTPEQQIRAKKIKAIALIGEVLSYCDSPEQVKDVCDSMRKLVNRYNELEISCADQE
jgi:hypothetical protein